MDLATIEARIKTVLDTLDGLTALSSMPDRLPAYPCALVYTNAGTFRSANFNGDLAEVATVVIELFLAERVAASVHAAGIPWPLAVAQALVADNDATPDAFNLAGMNLRITGMDWRIVQLLYESTEPHPTVHFEIGLANNLNM